MLLITAAIAGAVAAGGCCVAPTRRRARVLAIVMALACLPFLPELARMTGALGLLVAAGLLTAGSRRLPADERSADLHRAVGGALMAGMLLAGGHAPAGVPVGHAHGASLDPHIVFALGSIGYLGWTVASLIRPAHTAARGAAARVELSAMGAMFAMLILATAVR